jgi:hypothetical protein
MQAESASRIGLIQVSEAQRATQEGQLDAQQLLLSRMYASTQTIAAQQSIQSEHCLIRVLDVTPQETTMHPYRTFIATILISSTLMFCLMYLNTYQLSHVWFSQTRMFMTFIMAGAMALVMLFFMRHMYKDKKANVSIVIGSVALMGLGLWLVRSQDTVGDIAWMKAMIPHHSIAILTSERARITDPRVRKLADGIIETQRREIAEMESLIKDIRQQPAEGPRK